MYIKYSQSFYFIQQIFIIILVCATYCPYGAYVLTGWEQKENIKGASK